MKRFSPLFSAGGVLGVLLLLAPATTASAQPRACDSLPDAGQLQQFLVNAAIGTGVGAPLGPGTDAGGLFGGSRMWGSVVNRMGEVCATVTSQQDPTQVWPGSQAISRAKAYTANAFSLDSFVFSTARLYTLVQPGHSLYGLNQSNPFDPDQIAPPNDPGNEPSRIMGGIITFGGGVPLYRDGKIVGGLGVSGDTSCADHEVAKRVRELAGLNPPGGPLVDDIVYPSVDGPSLFAHSLCINTKRNGVAIGEETP